MILLVAVPVIISLVLVGLIMMNRRFAKIPINYLPAMVKVWLVHVQYVWVWAQVQKSTMGHAPIITLVVDLQTSILDSIQMYSRCYFGKEHPSTDWIKASRGLWYAWPLVLNVFTMAFLLLTLYLLAKPKHIFR